MSVDIIYGGLSLRGKALADLITFPVFLLFVGVRFDKGLGFARDAWAFQVTLSSAWAPPVYPFKTIIPIAAFLLLLQALAKFIRDLYTPITGRKGEL